jgi:uncharacterized protein involved in outer membrane biogenesis
MLPNSRHLQKGGVIMKKRKKWVIIAAAVFVVVIILVLLGLSKIGPLIKAAVNTYGPKITKTEVRLGDVGVSIFSGEAKLKDFLLGNPKGFNAPQAMKVGSIYVSVDEKSLTKDTIVINKIEVVRPEITYEKAGGTDNFQTILNNVKSAIGPATASKKPAEEKGDGKKLLIRDFILKEGKVNLTMTGLAGKTVGTSLPDIRLKDIGKSQGGTSPAEAFKEVFAALYKEITSPAVTDALKKGLKDIGFSTEALGGEAEKAVGSAGGEATKKLKGLFGK